MSLQIHYGGHTYDALNITMEDALNDLHKTMSKSNGRGIYYIDTPQGKVALLITASIPIAIEQIDGPTAKIL